jgi:hypothetical protein
MVDEFKDPLVSAHTSIPVEILAIASNAGAEAIPLTPRPARATTALPTCDGIAGAQEEEYAIRYVALLTISGACDVFSIGKPAVEVTD